MSNKKPSKPDLHVDRGFQSNRDRKADARISYRNAYPKTKCRWMGAGVLPPAKGGSGRAVAK